MAKKIYIVAALAFSFPSLATAEVMKFSRACETALALSAGPSSIRDDAGLYLLAEDGFEMTREAKNNYVCMVARERNGGVAPQCFDPAGQVSHVPVHIMSAKMRLAGVSEDEISDARAEGFVKGDFRPAPGPGVVYMASDYNFIRLSPEDKLHVAPHIMYHAPYLTDADIGSTAAAFANRGMPFVNAPGPLGFLISFVDQPTDSTDVEKKCKGQLPDLTEWRAFPAQG